MYYDRSTTTLQNYPQQNGQAILDITIKETFTTDAAIPSCHNLHIPITGILWKYRLERRANKDVATDNGLYNNTNTTQN
jgi:hypothetical protein